MNYRNDEYNSNNVQVKSEISKNLITAVLVESIIILTPKSF